MECVDALMTCKREYSYTVWGGNSRSPNRRCTDTNVHKAVLPVTKWLAIPFAPSVQISEPFQTALQWCLFPWLQIWKCPDWTVFIYPCTVYKTNSSCQTMLYNLFILKRHTTHFFLRFLYVHTCSWCILLEFYWEVITAVNNGNSLDTCCIFAQTIARALEKHWLRA